MLGKRKYTEEGEESNIGLASIGATLLWLGWVCIVLAFVNFSLDLMLVVLYRLMVLQLLLLLTHKWLLLLVVLFGLY